MTLQLEPELVASAITHMNEDHSDAVLAYVQAFGGKKRAVTARMVDIDASGMEISYLDKSGESTLRLNFDTPLARPADLRSVLASMAREARAVLAGSDS